MAGAVYGYMTNSKYTSKASLVVYPLVVDPAGTGSANSAKVDIATESRVAILSRGCTERGKVSDC